MAQSKNTRTTSTKAKVAAIPAAKTRQAPVVEVASTPVRNTPLPKTSLPPTPAAAPARKTITHEMIALRAFQISRSATSGSESDNWFRAEQELQAA